MTTVQSNNLIKGKTGDWEVVIGLEVHAQVISDSKLFSGAATQFGAEQNTQVSYIDAGFPGMLPVINTFCIEQAVKTGLGMNSEINLVSFFDRKNYFYPDLPQGYQISQFKKPIVEGGYIDIEKSDGEKKRIRVNRLHLEQDAGKSIHDQDEENSLIDLNRSGVALMEIVSEPDIRSIEEAQLYVKKLRALLRCLNTCDGNMEQGSLRADVNVSLRRPGKALGTRTETKNVNSIRFMGQAIDYEIKRQLEVLENNGTVLQETRLFDPGQGVTRSMRSKEEAHDYRYFPDPDLPPLVLDAERVKKIKNSLPELPDQKKQRFIDNFSLSSYDSEIMISETEVSEFFEKSVENLNLLCKKDSFKNIKILSNWIIVELFSLLNKFGVGIIASKINPQQIAELVSLIINGKISGKIAKGILVQMWDTEKQATDIVKAQGLEQVSDTAVIEKEIDDIFKLHADKVTEYQNGKEKLFGFFIGQIMKVTKGKANPQTVNDLLKRKLKDA